MDSAEFKAIFMPYHKAMYQVAYYFTGNALDAEDLLQEFYLRLWLKRNDLGEDKQNRAYLTSMLRNLYIDSARHVRPPIYNIDDIDTPKDPDSPEDHLIRYDNAEHISKIIGGLSEKEKEIIRLHLEEELEYKEIEKATGLSPGNLRVIISRAKQKIKSQFISLNKSWKK